MINFIYDLPKYVIANQCIICKVWYPKNTLVYCACCGTRLRIKKLKRDNRKTYKTHEQITRILESHVNVGWKLLNVKIWEDLQEWIVLEKKEKEKLR